MRRHDANAADANVAGIHEISDNAADGASPEPRALDLLMDGPQRFSGRSVSRVRPSVTLLGIGQGLTD